MVVRPYIILEMLFLIIAAENQYNTTNGIQKGI
jgi:hypothetical protein